MGNCIETTIISTEIFIDMANESIEEYGSLGVSKKNILSSIMNDLDQYLHTGDDRIFNLKLKIVDLLYNRGN